MIKKVLAGRLHAGDYLVVKEKTTTRYYHIDEIYKNPNVVKLMYTNKLGEIIHERHKPRHPVKIRVR